LTVVLSDGVDGEERRCRDVGTTSRGPDRPESAPAEPKFRWWENGRRAEHQKLIAHIEVLRERAKRVIAEQEPGIPPPALIKRLQQTVEEKYWRAGDETAHQYADALEELLPLVASAHYVMASMRAELGRPRTESVHVVDIMGWDRSGIEAKRREYAAAADVDVDEVAEILSRLYRARADEMRHDRLMSNLRRNYLPRLAIVIVAALTLISVAILAGEPQHADLGTWNELVLTAALGALGGALAAALKLRDIAELNPFRSVVTFLFMQPLVGAALGQVSWIVLRSGLVSVGTSEANWAVSGVVAFLAGYSEPFLLGILAKSMGMPR
jgi:hypothetical protein